jgi:sec-independent protein translocase protein TatC
MASFTLRNLISGEQPQLNISQDVDVDESVLEEASYAVAHPSPHRARDLQQAPLKTIAEHISELRRRALYCAIALLIGGVIGYRFQDKIISWLTEPLGKTLFYTSPAGGFDFLIKICIFFGFLLAIPVIMYNILRFIAPAVPHYVTVKTGKILIISISLAIAGASFAYYVSLPAALHFLNNFSSNEIQSLISAQEYFNFVMIYIAGFAALFQMPLLITFINKITPLNPKMLMKKQRVLILVSFIIAAVLTPTPDPVNQTIMALPIICLYQISIIIVWQENRSRRRKNRRSRPGFVAEPIGM